VPESVKAAEVFLEGTPPFCASITALAQRYIRPDQVAEELGLAGSQDLGSAVEPDRKSPVVRLTDICSSQGAETPKKTRALRWIGSFRLTHTDRGTATEWVPGSKSTVDSDAVRHE